MRKGKYKSVKARLSSFRALPLFCQLTVYTGVALRFLSADAACARAPFEVEGPGEPGDGLRFFDFFAATAGAVLCCSLNDFW